MQVRKVRLTIEYDPDWQSMPYNEIAVALNDERNDWISGAVTVQDLEASGTACTFTIEVAHD